ncbi:efflux transporter outer membrane subunit [Sphingobacterium sp. SRCM116780]|uniref:efflux transporter outer membrane subunit n=1 Tax=Sphingobacterium sp. SRCM116780 TaxID=2907623 RepID=UPI001F39DEC0|nr:efflux transporter outer membrane subunit [Sphingobacterium sp. SRCM116780]UIR54754.1 efflux transporter outer membrane subunit [Sphingobacterium sp. SRCM116780]
MTKSTYMNIKITILLVFILPLVVWSCKTEKLVSNQHLAPALPEQYRDQEQAVQENNIGSIPWRDFFQDRTLQNLIDSAIQHNVDMQLAIKNIESSQLMLRQAKAGYLPTLQLQVKANSTNPSNNSMNGLSLGQFLGQNHVEDYTASLGLSWEADLWGKIKSQNKVALASYLQTEEAKKAVQTQLISQVAQGYYQLLMLYQLHEIAQQNLRLSDSTLRIVQQQYEVGDISLLAVEQIDAQRLTAATLIPDFEQQIHLQENAIQILSGQLPKEIKTTEKLANIRLPEDLATGIPADLLSRRPDVKQAELAVTASQAYQQAAKAKMYPSLVISAEAGVNAFKASNWFNIPGSLFGAIAGSITQPILQRRELKTQYEVARVEQEKNVIRFKQTVITAVGEVSDALVSIQKLKEKQQLTAQRVNRLKTAIQHADLLFETGMATYLEVITAQSNMLQSELELAQVKKAELAAVVDLYRSLGGGWTQ